MLVGNAISSNLRSLIFKIFRGSMPPDPPRRTKISVRRFAAIRNFCILLGTHSKFGLDPRLVPVSMSQESRGNSQYLKTTILLANVVMKTDIESAFRIFPIHRDDWELLGMFWENQYFVDLFLPFGLRSAPFKFNISIAIAWILSHKCLISYVDFILDDFFIMEPKAKLPPHDQNCKVSLQSMLLTLKNLGIPISKHKTEGPSTVLQFLGILLDSVRMEARLPEDKVQRLRSDLSHWRTRKSATLQEIQSLIGTLNFACKVIPPGRPFLQRIIHLTRKVNKPYHHIKLNAGFREDIRMWQTFLDQWNGSNFFMHKDWATSEALHLYTDAASTVGFGGIFGTQWFQGKWQPNQTISTPGISIDWQELYAIVVACSICGKHWSRKRIIFHCDNQPVVEIINSKRSKSPTIMTLIRTLTSITLKHNFYFKALHVAGKLNPIADCISLVSDGCIPYPRSICRPVASTNPRRLVSQLKVELQGYMASSLAISYQKTYSSGEKRFIDFCYKLHIDPNHILPTNENMLVYFATYMARSVTADTVKVYLAAIRYMHILNGHNLDLKSFLRLQYVLKGIKRSQGSSKFTRLPITLTHLKLFQLLLSNPSFDNIMLWAALTLAFFGFLRVSEFTCSGQFNPNIHITPKEITFLPSKHTPTYMQIQKSVQN